MTTETTAYKTKISELRQTLAWMDIVLSNVADSVCVVKVDGSILFINDSFAEMVNQSRIDLLGLNIQDVIKLVPKASSYPEAFPFKETISTGSDSTKGIYEWQLNETDSITVKLIAHHIKPTDQIVVMLQNVTNEYEVEEISRNFANLASHQLKTPLSAIKMHAHMLAGGYMGDLQDKQLQATTAVLDATDHMNNLLDMLLDISKLDNNKYERRSELVNINEILERIRSEVSEKVIEKEIKLTIDTPAQLSKFCSDTHMLHEVFSNIITNALKYTPQKGKIAIKVTNQKDVCIVDITDNGIGIPKNFQDKIFIQFSRANNAIDSKQSGTGLGLYLVKQLVELLGGDISFTSQHQKGTTFTVKIPTNN